MPDRNWTDEDAQREAREAERNADFDQHMRDEKEAHEVDDEDDEDD